MRDHQLVRFSLVLLGLLGCGGSSRDFHAPESPPPPGSSPPPDSSSASISISPKLTITGSADLALTITGKGFSGPNVCLTCANSLAFWSANGQSTLLATTFVSDTQLIALVPAALLISAGSAQVHVETWVGQEDVPRSITGSAVFTIAGAATLGSISPASAPAGSSEVVLTVTGSGFKNEGDLISYVSWADDRYDSPSYLDTSFIDDTRLTAVVPAKLLQDPITARVYVETWDWAKWGSKDMAQRSNVLSFVVTP